MTKFKPATGDDESEFKKIIYGNEVSFETNDYSNGMHLFINGAHNPELCAECIEPGILPNKSKVTLTITEIESRLGLEAGSLEIKE